MQPKNLTDNPRLKHLKQRIFEKKNTKKIKITLVIILKAVAHAKRENYIKQRIKWSYVI